MAFFKRNYSKKNYDIEEVGDRMTLLNAVKAEFEDTKNEAINDIKNILVEEDMIDDTLVKYIPLAKKYLEKYDKLIELVFKEAEISINEAEQAKKNLKELREAVVGIDESLKGQNRILERIAVSLETEKIVGKK